MLKQIVVDKVMARQLWKLGFKEPTLSYYDVDGQLQNAEGDTLQLKDYNAPKETRGRGARCYSAPTILAVRTGCAGRSTLNYWSAVIPSSRIRATIIAVSSGFPMG